MSFSSRLHLSPSFSACGWTDALNLKTRHHHSTTHLFSQDFFRLLALRVCGGTMIPVISEVPVRFSFQKCPVCFRSVRSYLDFTFQKCPFLSRFFHFRSVRSRLVCVCVCVVARSLFFSSLTSALLPAYLPTPSVGLFNTAKYGC